MKKSVLKNLQETLSKDKTDIAGDIQGIGLNLLTRIASSELADQYGIRKPLEKALYEGSKASFKFMSEQTQKKHDQKDESTLTDAQKASRLAKKKQGLFDLSLTDDQQMTRDMLRSFAIDIIRPAAHDADHDHATPSALLDQLHELGLSYQAVPETIQNKEIGGMANADSTVSQMLSLEDLGYGDFAIALSGYSSTGVANAIRRYGSDSQQQHYLPKFLNESLYPASFATNEATPLFNPMQLTTKVKKTGSLYILTGEKSLVVNATEARLFVVSALYAGKPQLFLVDADSENIDILPEPSMGLKPANTCRVRFNGVRLLANTKLANTDYSEFLDLSRLAIAAIACGVGDAVLDYVIPYVNEREAFGEPISHRQSVAFMVSDIAIELESMRMLVWRAVARAQAGLPFHREAHLAHILASEKAMKIGTDAVQLLGGHGYTKEHPVECWYRDLRSVAILHGSLCL